VLYAAPSRWFTWARRLRWVNPTAFCVMHNAPSRARTRGSPTARPGPVDRATRSKAVLARTQRCPTRSVSSRRWLTSRALVCNSSRLRRRRWQRRSSGELTTVSIRNARPSPGRPDALLRPAPLRTGLARHRASGSSKPRGLVGGAECWTGAAAGWLPRHRTWTRRMLLVSPDPSRRW